MHYNCVCSNFTRELKRMKIIEKFQACLDKTYPQEFTYRFANEIIEVSEDKVVADFTFPEKADFYKGHFPGNPVTPGTILLESAVQCGVVPLLKFQLYSQREALEGKHVLILSTDIKYKRMLPPKTRVIVTAKKAAYNASSGILRSRIIMKTESNETVLHGKVTAKLFDFVAE